MAHHGHQMSGGGTTVAPAEPIATRTVLTKAQATKRLSRTCRKLVTAKRPSKLSKKDRAKRTKCLEQRRNLIERSRSDERRGVSGPTTPVAGPKPVAAPVAGGGSTTPTGTTPTATTPTTTTPAKTTPTKPSQPSGPTWDPCTPGGSTIGVTSTDAFKMYTLSKACAPAGVVTFNFTNVDGSGSWPHDLYIAAVDGAGEVAGALVKITGAVDTNESASGQVTLQAGRYLLICTVPGHENMNTAFQAY